MDAHDCARPNGGSGRFTRCLLAAALGACAAAAGGAALPDGTVGVPYRAVVPGAGAAPAAWTLVGGALPDGLRLDGATVAGTPTRAARFAFTVEAREAGARPVRRELTLRIAPPRVGAVPAPAKWTGTYDYRLEQHVPSGDQISTAHVDLALVAQPDGSLAGTADGAVTATLELSDCPSHTVTPAHFHADLTGTRNPEKIDLTLGNPTWGPITITPCPTGGLPGVIGGGKIYKVEEALKTLTSDDGETYRYHGQTTYPAGSYPFTVTHDITLRRAQ